MSTSPERSARKYNTVVLAMKYNAKPATPSLLRALHAPSATSSNASTKPYGMFCAAPMRCANVPTMPSAAPLTTSMR